MTDLWRRVMDQADRTWWLWPLRGLASLASGVYAWVVGVRNVMFDLEVKKVRRLDVPVISVGNIVVGGTGKTPLVMTVCRLLLTEGIRPAVVSRGYMRTDEQKVVVVGDGREVLVPPTEAGDEPWMMARGLAAPVIVGADRFRAALVAIDRFKPQVIVLDDGFQHRRLARDLDLVVLDAAAPLGVERLLPRGDLREPAASLRRASALVLSGPGPAADLDEVIGLELDAPRFRSRILPSGLYRFEDNDSLSLDRLDGQRVLALAALGRPERFADTLENLGADVVERRFFPDHHFFSAAELNEVAATAAGTGLIVVTTTKDAARLVGVYPPAVETWVLEVEAEVEPRDEFIRLLKGVVD